MVEILIVIPIISFIIERSVEMVVRLAPILEDKRIEDMNIKMVIAFAFSLVIVGSLQLDIFREVFGIEMMAGVGLFFTALLLAGGSNVIHDLLDLAEKGGKS